MTYATRWIDASHFVVGKNSVAVRCDEPPAGYASAVCADFSLGRVP